MSDDLLKKNKGNDNEQIPESEMKCPEPDPEIVLSGERYRAFIENINEGVYEVDIHGNFVYFNDALCQVFGYPKEEIQWQNFSKFMDEDHAKGAFKIFNRIYETGEGFSDLLWEIIDKDGKKRFIELSANLITNKDGEKIGFRGIARDVTERILTQKALKESELRLQRQYEISRKAEKRYKKLLDFVPYPIVVFSLDGRVIYLNPAFTETFGWTLKELEGKKIPYVPPGLEKETTENIKRLLRDKIVSRIETKRLTKDGRVLDVVMRGAIFSEDGDEEGGQLVILRDITQERKLARNKEVLLRISMALPRYPELEDLLDYITNEVKQLMKVEGALVILHDEEKRELFFQGASYDDKSKEEKIKDIRFPADKGVAGRVIRTGEVTIVNDTSKDPDFYPVVDEQLGFHTRNMVDVPLRSSDRIIGVLCALNKKEGLFDQDDVELLNMIAGTVALSIENARYSKELQKAYQEVMSLNRAKDRVINHLSHELKTPISVLLASLNILSKRLKDLPEDIWKPTIQRAERNLERLLEIQYQVEDIMQDRDYRVHSLLSSLVNVCADELESLVAEEIGEGEIIRRIREKIDKYFASKESPAVEIDLREFVQNRTQEMKRNFEHRDVEILLNLSDTPRIIIPEDVLKKLFDALLKNSIENTPDEGRIEITVKKKGQGAELIVKDYGVGITEENQKRIFEGFFPTLETMAYSSKRPFDFNAGGKGADLLRMKIFSERYDFRIEMQSKRCGFIPEDKDLCPGRISKCRYCKERSDCLNSGFTKFSVFFINVKE